jgi:hypothetical protein
MRISMSIAMLTMISCSNVSAENFPYAPIAIENNLSTTKNIDSARLKISIALDAADKAASSIPLGGVVVCSKLACYRPNVLEKNNNIKSPDESVKLIVDAKIPYSQIEKIYFEEPKGGGATGSIELSRHLNIEKGYYGGEIFVLFKQASSKSIPTFKPTFATSNLIREQGQSIYYNPSRPTVANLNLNVTLKIPANALPHPEIFNVSVHDTGERFPLVDIFPYLTLSKQASISAGSIQHQLSRNATSALEAVTAPPLGSDPNSLRKDTTASQPERSFTKTAMFNSSFFEGVQTSPSGKVSALGYLDGPETYCSSLLKSPQNMQTIKSLLTQSGIVYVNWCINQPPYVHIMYINTRDPRVHMAIPYHLVPARDKPGLQWLQLETIATFQQSAYNNGVGFNGGVAINGFTWTGDEGTGPNQQGLPLGYLTSSGAELGGNRVGGGSYGGTGASDGPKLLIGWDKNLANDPYALVTSEPNYKISFADGNAYHQLSSSTSILKEYATCSGDTTSNRWSAIGKAQGVLILVSSTSDGSTSAAELCQVFVALGAADAIRLDGGPSAAMMNGSTHLNPLTGLASFKYGSMRYIGYSVKVGSF